MENVFITKKEHFEIEFGLDGRGDICIWVDGYGFTEDFESDTVISRDELKNIIDGLTKIYEETEKIN